LTQLQRLRLSPIQDSGRRQSSFLSQGILNSISLISNSNKDRVLIIIIRDVGSTGSKLNLKFRNLIPESTNWLRCWFLSDRQRLRYGLFSGRRRSRWWYLS
jgi:hypothetical protein